MASFPVSRLAVVVPGGKIHMTRAGSNKTLCGRLAHYPVTSATDQDGNNVTSMTEDQMVDGLCSQCEQSYVPAYVYVWGAVIVALVAVLGVWLSR